MSQWIRNLLILLVVQLLVLALFQFSGGDDDEATRNLVDVSAAAVRTVNVDDGEGNSAELKRTDDGWQLASGLPADSAKIDGLLAKLADITLGWPVSTNESSHERFEVADEKFQRRLRLDAGDESAELRFGTSPGYQQVHARAATGDDAVYAVKLATYEMPAELDDWLDKSLLAPSGEISSASWGNGVVLTASGADWLLGDAPADAAASKTALDRLRNFAVLGAESEVPNAAPAGASSVLINDADGEYRLSWWQREAENDYLVLSTRYPGEAFRVANFNAEELVPAAADLQPPDAADSTGSDAAALLEETTGMRLDGVQLPAAGP